MAINIKIEYSYYEIESWDIYVKKGCYMLKGNCFTISLQEKLSIKTFHIDKFY